MPLDDLFSNKQLERGLHGKFQGVEFRRTRAVPTDESAGKYTSTIVIREVCMNTESYDKRQIYTMYSYSNIREGIQKAVQGTIVVSQLEVNLPGESRVCSSQKSGPLLSAQHSVLRFRRPKLSSS